MVNAHIHQFQGGSAVVDASAIEQFQLPPPCRLERKHAGPAADARDIQNRP